MQDPFFPPERLPASLPGFPALVPHSDNPKCPGELKRLRALDDYHILDTVPEPDFDSLTALAARLLDAPIAAITLLDGKRQWFKSRLNIPVPEMPQEMSFCRYTLLQTEPMVVANADTDVRFSSNPIVTGAPFIRFYAGAPLVTPDGQALGTLCVLDTAPRVLSPEQTETLAVLGRQVMAQMEVRRQMRSLTEARQTLAKQEYDFRMLAEHAPDAILRVDLAGRFLYVNPQGERLLGRAAASVVGNTCAQLGYPPAQCATFQAAINRAVAAGHTLEEDYVAPPPSPFQVLHKAIVPEFGPQGTAETVIFVARDVTARRQAETRALAEAHDSAERDALTGLLNHRGFQIRLAQAVEKDATVTLLLLDIVNFKIFNDVHGIAAGDAALCLAAKALQEYFCDTHILARYGGDEFAVLLEGLDAQDLPAFLASFTGYLSTITFAPEGEAASVPLHMTLATASFPQEATTRHALQEIALARLSAARLGDDMCPEVDNLRRALSLSRGGFSMLNALLAAVDNKDRYTRRHSEDVLRYCQDIACALGLDEDAQTTLQIAALLHDIGKIGVPDAILRKPGALSEEEFEAVQQHPMMGAVIVGAVPGFEGTLDCIRYHHERWDGQGYPFGLVGPEIPLLARIMAVADAYSAMTMDRPYRKGMSGAQAAAILQSGAGVQWDKDCVTALLCAR